MTKKQRSIYGFDTSEPEEKAGVEVGGGDKAAATTDRKARKEAKPGRGAARARTDKEPRPKSRE